MGWMLPPFTSRPLLFPLNFNPDPYPYEDGEWWWHINSALIDKWSLESTGGTKRPKGENWWWKLAKLLPQMYLEWPHYHLQTEFIPFRIWATWSPGLPKGCPELGPCRLIADCGTWAGDQKNRRIRTWFSMHMQMEKWRFPEMGVTPKSSILIYI